MSLSAKITENSSFHTGQSPNSTICAIVACVDAFIVASLTVHQAFKLSTVTFPRIYRNMELIFSPFDSYSSSFTLVAQTVENLPEMWEIKV